MASKKIILVDGLWGCGKTTLAKKLAAHFACPLLIFDEYRERLFDGGTFSEGKNHPTLNLLCKDEFLKDIALHLISKDLLIIEWDFEQLLLEKELQDFAKKDDLTFVIVHLFADVKVRIKRALGRLLKEERHQVHVGAYPKLRKLIGLALPRDWVPGPRDKKPFNVSGTLIRQSMDHFGASEFKTLCSSISAVLAKK